MIFIISHCHEYLEISLMELDETWHIHRDYTDIGNLTIIYIIYTYSSIYRDYDYEYLEIWVRKRGIPSHHYFFIFFQY
jgi:hypothetical protein